MSEISAQPSLTPEAAWYPGTGARDLNPTRISYSPTMKRINIRVGRSRSSTVPDLEGEGAIVMVVTMLQIKI